MGMSRQQAEALGIGHLFPAASGKNLVPAIARPAVSRAPDDGLNKLERAWWDVLREAKRQGHFLEVHEHALKLKVIGNRWYIPDFDTVDFASAEIPHQITIWETKGFMREDAALKLIAAAERYPFLRWVLVERRRKRWECKYVTKAGISKAIWTPEWAA